MGGGSRQPGSLSHRDHPLHGAALQPVPAGTGGADPFGVQRHPDAGGNRLLWGAGGLRYGVPSAAQPRRAFAGNAETDRLRPELAGLQGAGGGRNCTGGRRRRYDRGGICGGWL